MAYAKRKTLQQTHMCAQINRYTHKQIYTNNYFNTAIQANTSKTFFRKTIILPEKKDEKHPSESSLIKFQKNNRKKIV